MLWSQTHEALARLREDGRVVARQAGQSRYGLRAHGLRAAAGRQRRQRARSRRRRKARRPLRRLRGDVADGVAGVVLRAQPFLQ